MGATSGTWSPPAERARTAALVVVALLVFVGAWRGIHHGFYERDQIVDTPVYQGYGEQMAHGAVPYRDFTPEYPPLAMPVMLVPALVARDGDADGYRGAFEDVMLVCGGALVVFTALAARALGRDGRGPLAFVAVFPLALGTVVLTRFDLWPAALTAAALAALLAGRDRLGAGVLGAAFAAKLYPGVLLPLALVWVWRRKGRREALVALAVFVAVVAACFVPFLVLAPGGVAHSFARQLSRPLQIESFGAGLLLAAHQAFGLGITMASGSGSQNLVGTLPDVLAALQSVVQLAALVWIWLRFARGPVDGERLARAAAAAVVAFVALGKVLSPQFLIWLVPLVALTRLRERVLLLAALVVTQVWFPFRYWPLVKQFAPLPSWLVPLRDLLLVGLLVALVVPIADSRAGWRVRRSPGPSRTEPQLPPA